MGPEVCCSQTDRAAPRCPQGGGSRSGDSFWSQLLTGSGNLRWSPAHYNPPCRGNRGDLQQFEDQQMKIVYNLQPLLTANRSVCGSGSSSPAAPGHRSSPGQPAAERRGAGSAAGSTQSTQSRAREHTVPREAAIVGGTSPAVTPAAECTADHSGQVERVGPQRLGPSQGSSRHARQMLPRPTQPSSPLASAQ